MKFSVIIPLYNKAPYVRKALETVCAQTYRDYEIIVINDGSTDNSAIVAEEFLNSVEGINYKILQQKNAGVAAARNNGVAQANGNYLAFLDADDWWEPTYLERMAKLIKDYPDAGLYACNYVYYKPGKTHVALHIPTGYINYPKVYYQSNAMPVWTGATVVCKTVFEKIGGFPIGVRLGEDFLLWAQIAMQYPVVFLDEPLAWYNNDVPVALRATRNLHHPNCHMLFRMEIIGDSLEVKGKEDSNADTNVNSQWPIANRPTKADWKRLIDKLRVSGLLEYWMSEEYHDQAAEELKKVDWSLQPKSVIRIYKKPIWMLEAKRSVMRVGSAAKQALVKHWQNQSNTRMSSLNRN